MLSSFFRAVVLCLCVLGSLAQNGQTQWSVSPFNPTALPLAVRSPYLNSWLSQGGNSQPLTIIWPRNWDLSHVTGWYLLVVVDGNPYRISGDARADDEGLLVAEQLAVEFSPTRTSFAFDAGGMTINASFISTIEPLDLVRQSLPFSYLAMSAESTDGSSHDLRMYSDISGEFLTGDTSRLVQWTPFVDDQYVILSMELEAKSKYSESVGFAQDATEYYSFKKIDGTTISWAITNDTINRANAANSSSSLGNTTQMGPRPVNDTGNWTTLGIAIDWGDVVSTPEPAVWALGILRSPSVQYNAGTVLEDRYPYFLSSYSDVEAAVKAFLDDFPRARSSAESFDSHLLDAGQRYSSEYAELLSLTARQVMSSIDITITPSSDGDWNMMDIKAFMKNVDGIGTDALGSTYGVNTVDTLYAAFPAFLYLNPELVGYLLSPLLQFQDSSGYLLTYASRNIGTAYPNATADEINRLHDYGVEETANMLIMTLAYTQRSGNGTLLSRHYSLLRSWAEYLENNTMTSTYHNSVDFISEQGTPSSGQINLILKGIIGISCMARIAKIAGVNEDEKRFTKKASSYISEWRDNALASDESDDGLIYPNLDGLIYNLYADRLLQLDLVSESVYDALASVYSSSANRETYGLPLYNGNPSRTTAHWMMFSASSITGIATQNFMISQIHSYAASGRHGMPFPATYDPSTGIRSNAPNSGKNSPACGAMFALLALDTTIKSSFDLPADGSTIPGEGRSSSNSKGGAIAGGVVGGVFALIIALLTTIYCFRRRRESHNQSAEEAKATPFMFPYEEPVLPSRSRETELFFPIDERGGWLGYSAVGTSTDASPTQKSSEGPRLSGLLEGVTEDRERLRADVSNLRHDLERLRVDLTAMPPSYSDPGANAR